MTTYVVLRGGPGDAWIREGNIEATSAEAAIRKMIAGDTDPNGVFVAVPARSFTPVNVKVETKTQVRIGEVS